MYLQLQAARDFKFEDPVFVLPTLDAFWLKNWKMTFAVAAVLVFAALAINLATAEWLIARERGHS